MEKEYKLTQEYIELYKLLKLVNVAATGGHGKILIDEGLVIVNGETEFRKRAKIRQGAVIECEGATIKVV